MLANGLPSILDFLKSIPTSAGFGGFPVPTPVGVAFKESAVLAGSFFPAGMEAKVKTVLEPPEHAKGSSTTAWLFSGCLELLLKPE